MNLNSRGVSQFGRKIGIYLSPYHYETTRNYVVASPRLFRFFGRPAFGPLKQSISQGFLLRFRGIFGVSQIELNAIGRKRRATSVAFSLRPGQLVFGSNRLAGRQTSFRPAADFSKREFQMIEIGTLTAWIAGGHEHGTNQHRRKVAWGSAEEAFN